MERTKFSEITEERTKKTVKLRKGRTALFVSFILFLVLDIFLVTEYKSRGVNAVGYKVMEKVGMILESGRDLVTSIWEPELEHDGNFTSALIVGVDTRDVEFTGEEFISTDPKGQAGTRNTDTIMQVVYDHSNGNVFMISIPRDMGVDVEEECLEFHGSIHWVYDKGQSANCPGGGIQTLINKVEGVTGIKVQYYGFISLEVFTDIINAIGDINEEGERGIWIDIPEAVYELYPYGDHGWESIYFPAGYQFLTSEEALKFARSRKASSDYDRARRQQMVIEAVKDRIMSSDTLLNPKKILSLLNIFKEKSLFSDLSLDEIRAGLNLARDLDKSEIINIVIDPELGGHEVYINKQPHDRLTAQYYMVPTQWKECPGNEFCRVQDFLQKIMKYPRVYEEDAKVFVYAQGYDSSWKPNFDNSTYQSFRDNALPIAITESQYIANVNVDQDIIVYDFTDGEKVNTLNAILLELGVEATPGNEGERYRINKEDIAILVRGE